MAPIKETIPNEMVQTKLQEIQREVIDKIPNYDELLPEINDRNNMSIIQTNSPSVDRLGKLRRRYVFKYKEFLSGILDKTMLSALKRGAEIDEKKYQKIIKDTNNQMRDYLLGVYNQALGAARYHKTIRDFISKHEQELGDKLIGTPEAATILCIGKQVVIQYAKSGKIRGVKCIVGDHQGRYYFPKSDIERVAKEDRVKIEGRERQREEKIETIKAKYQEEYGYPMSDLLVEREKRWRGFLPKADRHQRSG